jgi:hypothetical protein
MMIIYKNRSMISSIRLLLIVLSTLALACTQSDGSKKEIPDFLALSRKVVEASKSYLAGVPNSDSSGPYVIKEYYSDTLSFRILLVLKNRPNSSVEITSLDSSPNDYQDFIAYAFVYPMLNPDKIGYHDSNVRYPVTVKTYFRNERTWKFLDSALVKNQIEFGRFEVSCIQEGKRR